VTLDSSGFTGEGDIHLFGEMLNRFFALYADMNQFNQLTLFIQPGNASGGKRTTVRACPADSAAR
jgi:type VI secretion system protein ImpG